MTHRRHLGAHQIGEGCVCERGSAPDGAAQVCSKASIFGARQDALQSGLVIAAFDGNIGTTDRRNPVGEAVGVGTVILLDDGAALGSGQAIPLCANDSKGVTLAVFLAYVRTIGTEVELE